MPENPSPLARLKRRWWRALLGVVAAAALVMLVMNPELAAMSFLFDPVLLDVAIVFLSTQMLLFNSQIRAFFAATWSRLNRRFMAVRLKRRR